MKCQGMFLIFQSRIVHFSLIFFVSNVFIEVFCQTEELIIPVSQGEVRGTFETYKKGNDDVSYSVFRGIPYAKAPVGDLRLKDPEKPENFSSVYDATSFGSICPQWDSQGNITGDENCLFLNIYTPLTKVRPKSQANYPVMVFIHGGNFQKGSSNPYQQHRFIDNEIILVTFNYRLGILGFLSTGDGACPGNLGLKDQVLALQWIQDNIGNFGGNSSAITLFGQGAGAVSVFLHILSPKSQGLFHKAIAQSGSPLCYWTLEEDPGSYAKEVAQRLRCSTKSSATMISCIREKSLEEILEAQKDNKTFGDYPLRAIPVVEPEGFLPDAPAKLLESGAFNSTPLISGINKDDGSILYSLIRSYEDILKKNSSFLLSQLIPMFLLTATDIRGNIESVAQAVYFQYFYGIDPTNVSQVLQSFVNMSTDAMFTSCNYRALQSYSATGALVYMYTFEYKGQYSMLEIDEGNKFSYNGVSHGDELLYLFDLENIELSLPSDKRKKEQMNYLWAEFAKPGKFPPKANAEYPNWEPYNIETKFYYKIDSSIEKHTSYRQREIDFWLKHLPALSKIMPPNVNVPPDVTYEIGGFGWSMLAIAIILLILLVVAVVVWRQKTHSKYFTTKTDDK